MGYCHVVQTTIETPNAAREAGQIKPFHFSRIPLLIGCGVIGACTIVTMAGVSLAQYDYDLGLVVILAGMISNVLAFPAITLCDLILNRVEVAR